MDHTCASQQDELASISCRTVRLPGGGAVVVVTVTGEIDMLTEPLLRERLHEALNHPDGLTVLVDLSGVTFFASTGIGAIADARRLAQERAVVVELVMAPGTVVDRAFHLMGMHRLLVVYPSGAEALAAHSHGAGGAGDVPLRSV